MPREVQQNIDMESYRIQQVGSSRIALERKGGVLDPQSTKGGYTLPPEEIETLSRIIATLNERFGLNLGGDFLIRALRLRPGFQLFADRFIPRTNQKDAALVTDQVPDGSTLTWPAVGDAATRVSATVPTSIPQTGLRRGRIMPSQLPPARPTPRRQLGQAWTDLGREEFLSGE